MPQPRISVVIITRNRKEYLRECLESVFSQSYPDLEILIGDNGSEDGTRPYLEALASSDKRIRTLFYPKNLGSCEGRNKLLQIATGALWFIIDDDAFFTSSEDLTRCAEEFERLPKAGAIGFTVVNAKEQATLNLWMYQADPVLARDLSFRSAQFASCAVCFRASAMQDAAFAQGEYFVNSFFYSWDEFPIAWRLLETGWDCWYSPRVSVGHYGSATIDTPTAHRVRLDAKSVGQFAGLILPFPSGWWKYVVRLSAWMIKRAVRTHTLSAALRGFMQGVPAFFFERKKRRKVRPTTVLEFIARVEAEKEVGSPNSAATR